MRVPLHATGFAYRDLQHLANAAGSREKQAKLGNQRKPGV